MGTTLLSFAGGVFPDEGTIYSPAASCLASGDAYVQDRHSQTPVSGSLSQVSSHASTYRRPWMNQELKLRLPLSLSPVSQARRPRSRAKSFHGLTGQLRCSLIWIFNQRVGTPCTSVLRTMACTWTMGIMGITERNM
ncbi:hypothetical protein BC628DRAFT_959840 [Trametes gibbosa]|nr:hypothetical protein BC628DRAFT_959840 [Trametes gibbosa]